ncbi:hypothetical protein A3C87_01705 [Candidatus Kaiserbacteria bacterium RIFCSPHIGHO2_02_FULL_49_34]|uniref:Uncharacterized protein n=1 Tax=Candidatus Kaiserbacteria bacterium RIFCSPHIGHO2_02_FULL_49_34 TaxID=1798491 RepID=A0A1F6DL05_9BACT|nr:MAG: hypothetical protein A3C87_01705 [Candidatus Kaiserbacteria bacterium RIFCSPHIGHO2_02_FULL_49_34]
MLTIKDDSKADGYISYEAVLGSGQRVLAHIVLPNSTTPKVLKLLHADTGVPISVDGDRKQIYFHGEIYRKQLSRFGRVAAKHGIRLMRQQIRRGDYQKLTGFHTV